MLDEDHNFVKNRWQILTNDEQFTARFARQCRHVSHEHCVPSETHMSLSAQYSIKLFEDFDRHFQTLSLDKNRGMAASAGADDKMIGAPAEAGEEDVAVELVLMDAQMGS